MNLTLGKHYFRNGVGTALDHMAGTCYLCRVLQTRHSAKANFTVCLRSSTRQKANLPSVKMLPSVFWITLGILPVAECSTFGTRQSGRHSATIGFPVVNCVSWLLKHDDAPCISKALMHDWNNTDDPP